MREKKESREDSPGGRLTLAELAVEDPGAEPAFRVLHLRVHIVGFVQSNLMAGAQALL